MKQYQITRGYNAMNRMANTIALPVKKAYELYSMMKFLEPTFNARIEAERKLIRDMNGRVDHDGSVVFDTPDNALIYREALIELNDMDTEVEFKPMELALADIEGQKILPADIDALEGFIEFK